MNHFSKEDCKYTKFTIAEQKLDINDNGEYALISIPFKDDTPECIKNKLNDIIFHEMNDYIKTVEYMPMPCGLLLNASMQIQCFKSEEIAPCYFIAITITDSIPEIGEGTWIHKTFDLFSESSKFLDELASYCRDKFDQLFFSKEQQEWRIK